MTGSVALRSAMVTAIALVAAAGCSTSSPSHAASSWTPANAAVRATPTAASGTAKSSSPALAACGPATLGIQQGPRLSPASGEHGLIIAISTKAPPCTVAGYPTIKFLAKDAPIPFTYVFGKGQYVTHRRPQPVTVGGGKVAYFLVAKYRCDMGVTEGADGMTLLLPGQGTMVTPPRTWLIFSIDYCTGGANDPGNTIEVSPFEPSVVMLAT